MKDQCIGMNIKQKVRIKIRQINIDIFLNRTLSVLTDCFVLIYSNSDDNAKRFKSQRNHLPKASIKNYNIMTSSSIEKGFMTKTT